MNADKIAKENIARLNTSIKYIEENLSEKLSLEIIAEKAHFSSFHFHRLFKVIVGETLNSFINRKRIEKAASYLSRYKKSIGSQGKQCIGSFAFLWGQKQEYTSTWYGLFTDDGMPTEAIDELQFCWSGSYPENRAPTIDSIHFESSSQIKNLVFAPGKKYEFEIYARDREGDKLNFKWELYEESSDKKSGGDAEDKPPLIYGKIKGSSKSKITLKAPFEEGRYRLFIFVNDTKKVAYMNVPFYVENDPSVKAKKVRFKSQTLKSFNE
mgnify:CR=1 FL=1